MEIYVLVSYNLMVRSVKHSHRISNNYGGNELCYFFSGVLLIYPSILPIAETARKIGFLN